MSTVARFKTIVPIDNPSGREEKIRDYIQQQLVQMGFSDALVDAGGNLFVRIPGNPNKETILLSAHMDSVPPCEGIVPVEDTHEGRQILRSEGKTILGADDKSGIATILQVVSMVKEKPGAFHPLELLFSTREEVGLLGAKAFDMNLSKATMGLVLDGEGSLGDIFYAGPSQKNLVFELEGIASHAGIEPELGVNAIVMASHLCSSLPSGRLSADTTMNIGTIEGGHALNIVAPSAKIRGEARSHDNDALERLMLQIGEVCHEIEEQFPRGKVSFSPNHRYSRYEVPVDHPVILKAQAACDRLGISSCAERMNIGSDAHILNHNGLPTIVLGMGFHYSHSLGEFIYVDELERVSQWVLEIIKS